MPPRLVGLLTVTGLRQVNGLCDSGAHAAESSINPIARLVQAIVTFSPSFFRAVRISIFCCVYMSRDSFPTMTSRSICTHTPVDQSSTEWLEWFKHTYNNILGLSHLPKSGSQLAWLLLGKKSDHLWGFESLANGSLDCLKSTGEMTGITI